ncbi:MAG: hypothetical protein UU22_C0023G0004 [Parcubacteria group bacterium GW2011_GWA2_40_8]|nr:MAG: hypothetical protein UT82_C0021G0016 [Parcubacteria group bacterium GW2011_GWB1_40_14]KKR78453.1 MAG: hypothetical protein UU22_C0023G0004 [Parcubacteria group bacterium GW2011_GWA2_40_8]
MEPSTRYNRNEKLTFGDLKIGDTFIAFPLPGDNSGHGGYKGAHWIFMKLATVTQSVAVMASVDRNSIRLLDGVLSNMPDSMPVIKVE